MGLKPGETKAVTFSRPADKLAFYDEAAHGFVVEPGAFEVLVGSSSADIRLTGEFEVSDGSH